MSKERSSSPIWSSELKARFDKMRHQELSRRQALYLTALGIGAVSLADKTVTASKWGNPKTSVSIFETAGIKNGELTLVIPGLGVQSGEGIMRALMPGLRSNSELAGFIDLADTGLDIDNIADGINRAHHALGFKALKFYLHSMGGTLPPDIIARLDPNVPLAQLDYNCTPWTADYVQKQEVAKVVAGLHLTGTFGTKLMLQTVDRMFLPQVEDLSFSEKMGVIWNLTNDDSSPATWLNQLNYLCSLDLSHYDNIPENIKSRFFAPKAISSDDTVLLGPTLATYQDRIPGRKQVVFVEANGHANPRQHPKEYILAMQDSQEIPKAVFDSASDIVTPKPSWHRSKWLDEK